MTEMEQSVVIGCLFVCVGQYYETCDGSSSSLSLNTSSFPLGAEVMEVLVYRQRETRKYSPLTVDSTVYHITGTSQPITDSISCHVSTFNTTIFENQ